MLQQPFTPHFIVTHLLNGDGEDSKWRIEVDILPRPRDSVVMEISSEIKGKRSTENGVQKQLNKMVSMRATVAL